MTVIYQNQLYGLDMSIFLYKKFKNSFPDFEVTLTLVSDSTYTYQEMVRVGDTEPLVELNYN